jgi:hypothetical protein
MALTTRQSSLLVQQDWTKIYQTFREADFQSYDFETLRKSMIDYLQRYYPEDFNDFIDSSEYIALIDLIAFLGQSLAFRTDLNARENFLDTADRRDSILKLARLISYNPKRNISATGYLKIDSVSTTENVTDSNGLNLANLNIKWNDSSNDNWLEQFTSILNATLITSQTVGKPGGSQTLNGVKTDEYTISIPPGQLPTIPYTAQVKGITTNFEAISATSAGEGYVYEIDPSPIGGFNFLYRNDNLGNGSNNTGFFLYFTQGTLQTQIFNIADSLPNRVVNINFDNINNSDVWLYALNQANNDSVKWSQVPAVSGLNIIYNNSTQRNLFQVNTRANDQIDLVFGDGSFTNVPQGNFKLYYRQGNNLSYKITPDEMQNITLTIPYISAAGATQSLTIRASLKYTVTNAATRESIADIRAKAPQQYYTQNRMITGEDYNILPYTMFSDILKIKAVNRTSSGISRYLDVNDVTGKYSSTNIFAQDGIIYDAPTAQRLTFQFSSSSQVAAIVINQIVPLIQTKEMTQLFYSTATRPIPTNVGNNSWIQASFGANSSVGYFVDANNNPISIGLGASNNFQFITVGSLIHFTAPAGYYFNAQNNLIVGSPQTSNDRTDMWASVSYNNNTQANLNSVVPSGAIIDSILPAWTSSWTNDIITTVVNNILIYNKKFGFRYSTGIKPDGVTTELAGWKFIDQSNISDADYSLAHAGDQTGNGLDSSWFIKFEYINQEYVVTYRGLCYTFESVQETRFYFDPQVKVYDSTVGKIVYDQIKVLKTNTKPDSLLPIGADQTWTIYNNVVESDGYEDNTKILVTFPDTNSTGIPDDPDLFAKLVAPQVNPTQKYVYFRQNIANTTNFINLVPVADGTIISAHSTRNEIISKLGLYPQDTIFYAYDENKFYQFVDPDLVQLTNYIVKTGRTGLYFQYTHASPSNRRIDPSPTNIMDVYVLTQEYSNSYFNWVSDTTGKIAVPSAPTSEQLSTNYGALSNYKALSDTIIYNTVTFKPLFGSKANTALQATFKVVKNPNIVVSDNDVKSSVINAINTYFDIANWDFGETFYFSELSAYLHQVLVPTIASIIIVPTAGNTSFGGLYQVNAEPNEIIVSAATVDNVQIISAITAAQINQSAAGLNT